MEEEENNIEKWIGECEKAIEEVKKLSPKDRLELVSAILLCTFHINSSTLGWKSWLISPIVMDKFEEKELQEVFKQFQRMAQEFLELDIKYTKLIGEKTKKETPKEIKKRKELTYLT